MDTRQITELQSDSRFLFLSATMGHAKALETLLKMRATESALKALGKRYALPTASHAKQAPGEQQYFKSMTTPPLYESFFGDMKVPPTPPTTTQKSRPQLHPFWGDLLIKE